MRPCSGVPAMRGRLLLLNSRTRSEARAPQSRDTRTRKGRQTDSRTHTQKKTRTDLQGGAGDEETVLALELAHNVRELGLLVLDAVGLVNHNVAPVELLEGGLLDNDHLVRGHAHVPLGVHHHVLDRLRLGKVEGVGENMCDFV